MLLLSTSGGHRFLRGISNQRIVLTRRRKSDAEADEFKSFLHFMYWWGFLFCPLYKLVTCHCCNLKRYTGTVNVSSVENDRLQDYLHKLKDEQTQLWHVTKASILQNTSCKSCKPLSPNLLTAKGQPQSTLLAKCEQENMRVTTKSSKWRDSSNIAKIAVQWTPEADQRLPLGEL